MDTHCRPEDARAKRSQMVCIRRPAFGCSLENACMSLQTCLEAMISAALMCASPGAGELQVHRFPCGPGASRRLCGRGSFTGACAAPLPAKMRVKYTCVRSVVCWWSRVLSTSTRSCPSCPNCTHCARKTLLEVMSTYCRHANASQVPRQLFRSSSFATVVAGELGMFGFPPEVRSAACCTCIWYSSGSSIPRAVLSIESGSMLRHGQIVDWSCTSLYVYAHSRRVLWWRLGRVYPNTILTLTPIACSSRRGSFCAAAVVERHPGGQAGGGEGRRGRLLADLRWRPEPRGPRDGFAAGVPPVHVDRRARPRQTGHLHQARHPFHGPCYE